MPEHKTIRSLGPFLGVQDGRNPSLDAAGILRAARHVGFSGFNRLEAAPGSNLAMTLLDDQVTPAACTSVAYIGQFADFAIAAGHSTVTQKVYLYLLAPDLTGWYSATEVLTATLLAAPVGVLWINMSSPPVLTVAELLNTAYLAHNAAADVNGLYFATRQFSKPTTTWTVADVTGEGNPVYFNIVVAFQGHLIGSGFDFGINPALCFRPELIRFGEADGGAIDGVGSGSFTVGHRVRSKRDSVVNMTVAGDVCYIGTPTAVWPLIGYGRDSWDKSQPIDDSEGIVGPLAAVAVIGTLYYWSSRGPMRVTGRGIPQPLWDAIPDEIAALIDPQKIVAAYDSDRDQVQFFHRAGAYTGNQLLCAFDVRREKFVTADTDIGFPVACAALIAPVVAAGASGATPPAGPPTAAVTSDVFQGSALLGWTNGDTSLETTTIIQYREQGATTWLAGGTAATGVTSAYLTGLDPLTAYEWRVFHRRFGMDSAALGPSVATQFTTSNTCRSPVNGSVTFAQQEVLSAIGNAAWTNSVETNVSTEIEVRDASTVPWILVATVGPGVASSEVTVPDFDGSTTKTYELRVLHVRTGTTDSTPTSPVSAIFQGLA